MKKVLAIILTLLMIIGLCACGTNDEEKPYENTTHEIETPTNTNEPTTDKEETKPITNIIPEKHTYNRGVTWKENITNITDFNLQEDIGEKLGGGDQFPLEPQTGDIYLDYDSFMYVYNMRVNENMTYTIDETMNGWSVRRITTMSQPKFNQQILSEIAGKPVVSARYTFYMTGENVPTVVMIPETIVDITGMFQSTGSHGTNVIFKGTPTTYDDCFKDYQVIGVVDGKPVMYIPEYKIIISGNCDKEILKKIADTANYNNVFLGE